MPRWPHFSYPAPGVYIQEPVLAKSNEFGLVCEALFHGQSDPAATMTHNMSLAGMAVANGSVVWRGPVGGIVDRWKPTRAHDPMSKYSIKFNIDKMVLADPSITVERLLWEMIMRIVEPMWMIAKMEAEVVDNDDKIGIKLHVYGIKGGK